MKTSKLWLRSLSIRLSSEWQRLGGLRALVLRLAAIQRAEGWAGIQKRLLHLTARGPRLATDESTHPGKTEENRADTAPEEITAPGVLLIGHPHAILGVGENLRAISLALGSSDIPFKICNAFEPHAKGNALLQDFSYQEQAAIPYRKHSTNLFCLNANEMDMALSYLGSEIFDKSHNIACWMWELSGFPDEWTGNFRYVQEIWAQSRFVQEAIAKKSPVPVIWMPQVVEPGAADPAIAQALGIPKDVFTFLFFFDFTSHMARKNPRAVIDAFTLAFKNGAGESVALVVKMNGMDKCPHEYRSFLDSVSNQDKRIIFIDKVLSDREIKGLISGCDVFVSLHRSEGFGRGIAEAMYYGKPTVATGYSGNMDFTNCFNSCLVDYHFVPVQKGEYPFWKGQFWAEPDIEHAAHWMHRLYQDRQLCRSIGEQAAESIRATHSALAAGTRMRDRLDKINAQKI
ncbi:glycosyltransferase [Polaromonas sp. YR568]|uniref:glycosyltransferase n=1 Tax=Polaromonas sp. YR568 TaxID=1855301 RepID=UPI00398BE24B